jgi:uncharacterized membrane protein
MNQTKSKQTLELVQVAMFLAIILLLAFTPNLGYIPVGPTRATIIHIPVILGAIALGPKKGAFLGSFFGLTSLINNTINPTVTSFVFSPFYTLGDVNGGIFSLIICFVPRILVGVVPFFIYALIRRIMKTSKASNLVGLTIAGILGSMTNTLLVMNMIYFFFGKSYAAAKEASFETLYNAVILPVITFNGVIEAIVAGILTCAIGIALIGAKIIVPPSSKPSTANKLK